MSSQHNYLSQYSQSSEVYRKLYSLANDIKNSYIRDCDETSSIKEITEILNSILIMESLEEYFSDNRTDLYYFMGEFSSDVIDYILRQDLVYGEDGNELALNLLFHYIKLFMKFHKNKEYTILFDNIRKIFEKSSFYTKSFMHEDKVPIKSRTYEQFNEEFCNEFKKEKKIEASFKEGDKVDIMLTEQAGYDLHKKMWIRGIIKEVEDNKYYIVKYPQKNMEQRTRIPIGSGKIQKEGTMTKDWDWRLNLKKFDIVDCYDRGKWYPATVYKVKKYDNELGPYIDYKIGYRLYPDKFKYDYNTLLEYYCFWDNNNDNPIDKEGNSYYGDSEHADDELPFYSKRIQKFQTFSLIQKEALSNQINQYNNQYNNLFGNNNGQTSINVQTKNNAEERIKNMTKMLCYEKDDSDEDEIYFYEKDGKKNYILGKKVDDFAYYFGKLLKMMEKEGYFDEFISFLKDKPNMIELYNIFYIIIKCEAYLHIDFFKENNELFRTAFLDTVETLSSKDIKYVQKDYIESSIDFLTKVDYIISGKKNFTKNDIRFRLSIKLIKSSIFDKKIHGLKMLTEHIKSNLDQEDIKYVIEILKKNDIIKELFGSNYHTQIINKSNEILEFMFKNNELTEEDIKLIWSLTEQGDLEARMTVIKLLSDFIPYLNEKFCNIILDSINIEKITSLNEKEIDLIKNLAIKGNNSKFMSKCCEVFINKILETKDLNVLEKSPYVNIIVELFEKDEFCCKRITEICEGNLEENKNVLITFYLLGKIVEKIKKKMFGTEINNDDTNDKEKEKEKDFIRKEINKLIENNKLLILFENSYEDYKQKAQKSNNLNKYLEIDGYSHNINMKYRIMFLIKVIPVLYPKFDFFSLLKKICLEEPIQDSDKLLFYETMEKFISDGNKDSNDDSNGDKISIKEQLFNMLTNEKKEAEFDSTSQFKLYINLFLEINKHKNYLTFFKPSENYIINIDNNVKIDDLFGFDKLWEFLFKLNSESLSKKLIKIIYTIYETKNEIQVLFDKCINLIKNSENINFKKLNVCMTILEYIINDSEKKGAIQIKSHNDLQKDCLICLNLELKKSNPTNTYFYLNNTKNNKNRCILCGNMTLIQIKQYLAEIKNLEEKDITINLKSEDKNITLDESYNNKNLKEIFSLNRKGKRGLTNSEKLKCTGNFIEKENLVIYGNNINSKFERIIKECFNTFTNGSEIMDKDAIDNYINQIDPSSVADESNSLYKKLMKYDSGNKSCLLEEEFIEFYTDLAKRDEDTVWEHLKKIGYGKDLEKIPDTNDNKFKIIENNKLPRYILGNDIELHEALLKHFQRQKNCKPGDKGKIKIYEFLFFLCTNEKKYNELLDNVNKLIFVENKDNINYLEELYNLYIIQSFFQDLQIRTLNLEQIFKEDKKKETDFFGNRTQSNNKVIMVLKEYLPFDDEKNLEKKRLFLINFIENGGYEKIINYTAKTFASIDDEYNTLLELPKEKNLFCKISMAFIIILHEAFINKDKYKEKKAENDVYYLFEQFDINKILSSNDEKEKEKDEEKINKLKEIVLNANYLTLIENILLYLLKLDDMIDECFKLFLTLITKNEKLFAQFKTDEKIKQTLINLIKKDMDTKTRNFIGELKRYLNNFSSKKQGINKLDNEFLIYLFEISNTIFNELIINKIDINNDKDKSKSILYYFEYFSQLLKEILNNNQTNDINNILKEDFISQIFTLLYNDITEKERKNKLPEEIFLGMMQILITIIKNNKEIKEKILSTKVNDETLFDVIFKKLIPNNENNKQEINEYDNDLDIDNLIAQMPNNDDIDPKFIKVENLSEIIHIFNTTKKEEPEEIISDEVSIIFKDFIMACFTDCTKVELITKLLKILLSFDSSNRISTNKNKIKKKKEPKKFGYVGLKNIGCICYMNSILQQMYMVLPFRNAIMSSDDKKRLNNQICDHNRNIFDDNLLHQLQKMYTFLTFSEKQAYNPIYFCSSFKDLDGQPINILLQQDSQEFFNTLCDKIENILKKTKYKYIIDNIFTGKMCSSVICEKCNTVSNRLEDFYNLTLEIKNFNNLYDSLKKFTQPEKIEEFYCETCKAKVTISKRTSLAKLPNVLFVHLKRFYMNYETEATEKINSKFEFPNTINLKNFCAEEITKIKDKEQESDEIYPKQEEYYEYELKGINVHLGGAEGGHYISFIDVEREGKNNEPNIKSSIENGIIKSKWLKFNDSVVSQFDTMDIPVESYGGYVDNDISNENRQNAYLLIYERKKKTPIKIVIEKDEDKENDNDDNILKDKNYKIISFPKEQRNYINKHYDISYINFELKEKENDLYKIIFKDEEKDEYYYYIPYYNIEKNVLKENFTEVMNKNKKFLNRSSYIPINLSKYKDKWYEILFSIINTKEFNILNPEFLTKEYLKLFENYFKTELFDNKIYNNTLLLEDEQKIIINDKANILLKKIILPLVNEEEKNDIIYDILDDLCTNLTKVPNMNKIYEVNNAHMTGIFTIENVKLFCDVIYSMNTYKDKLRGYKRNFKDLFNLSQNVKFGKEVYPFPMNNNKEDKDDYKKMTGYYYIDLIYKILKIDDDYIKIINNDFSVSFFIGKIKENTPKETRKIIYEMIMYLLEKKKLIKIDGNDVKKLQRKMSDSGILTVLIEEKIELFNKLIYIVQYDEEDFSHTFNSQFPLDLFKYELKRKKLIPILNALFGIINIKDDYILDRLYFIMGFPIMIIKNKKPKKEKEEKENKKEDENKIQEEEEEKDDDDNNNDDNEEKYTLFPKFGCQILEENKNADIFKYRGISKIYESHCILAQLFPCTDINLYAYPETIKKDQKLTEKERNDYIYKLLTMSLIGEGNYALFKYIYLTQSRFIKYNNLYEEILDILSNDKNNNYDLTEIKKNADICIKRIKYEINIIKQNMSIMMDKKLDINLDELNKDEQPSLPENMETKYNNNDKIKEFTGFYPTHLPDKIVKVEYIFNSIKNSIFLFDVNYYTTYKEIKKLKNEEKEEEKKEEEKDQKLKDDKINEKNEMTENDKNEIKIEEKEEQEKREEKRDKNDDDEDKEENEYKKSKIKIVNRSQIKDDEVKLLNKLYDLRRESKTINQITIINDTENIQKNESNSKLTVKRAILFNYHDYSGNVSWEGVFSDGHITNNGFYNYYFPNMGKGILKKMDDLLVIYRRNINLDFSKENNIQVQISHSQKYLDDSNGASD